MNKNILITASVFGTMAVIFGAFGAHYLKSQLTVEELAVWKTGVDYQFYHTLALLGIVNFSRTRSRLINAAFWFFSIGIILFSGSLYLLALKSSIAPFIGPVTPVGGLFLILGWLSILLATIKNK